MPLESSIPIPPLVPLLTPPPQSCLPVIASHILAPCMCLTCILCVSGVHLVYIWFGVHWVYIWCTFGVHWVYIWCSFGVHLVFIWCVSGVYLVYIWCIFVYICCVQLSMHKLKSKLLALPNENAREVGKKRSVKEAGKRGQ